MTVQTITAIFLLFSFRILPAETALIEIQPDEQKPERVIMNSGKGRLIFYRHVWQAMNLETASGKILPVIDLFFYITHAEGIPGGYWTDPKNWDTQLSFQHISRKGVPNGPRTLFIEGSRNGLKKQVFATIYPGQPIIYVVNRLVAVGKAVQVKYDKQLTWFPKDPKGMRHASQVVLDGQKHPIDKGSIAKRYAYFFLPNQDACLAILFTPMAQQQLGTSAPLQYNVYDNGAEIGVAKGGKLLASGEMLEQRYAIYWSDGQKLDKVKELDALLSKRSINKKRFYPPPELTSAELALERKRKAAEAKVDYERRFHEYLEQASKTEWSEAQSIRVRNPADVDDTLAVVVPVKAAKGQSFQVVNEDGRPIVTQSDDLDDDGTIDEVCFLLSIGGGKQRTVLLLSTEGAVTAAPSDMRVQQIKAGSWEPVRMQPTSSPGTRVHSTYISPANSARARKIMARLNKPVSMEKIECDDFRLLLGHTSGLIEGMRPANLAKGYLGSYLREFLPDESNTGTISRRFGGPVRCRFEWQKIGRSVTVYRNGVIESKWEKAPEELQIIACAYPYRYAGTGPSDVIRYSQIPEMQRDLPGAGTMSLFGRNNASLLIEAEGIKATEHQVWLDGGEIGWEVAIDLRDKKSGENPSARVGRLCADTLISGGLHVTTWKRKTGPASIAYRIANHGEKSWGAAGLVRISGKQIQRAGVPKVPAPKPKPPVSVQFHRSEITVNRLHPNQINGWELRPVKLAKHNPQPAYFAAELVNHTNEDSRIDFSLDGEDWIEKATLLSGRETLYHDKYTSHLTPSFKDEVPLVTAGKTVPISVPKGETVTVEVCIYPKGQTLGRQKCTIRWRGKVAGSADLKVIVKPTIMFMPVYAPATELGAEYANISRGHSPLSYDLYFFGGTTEARTRFNKALFRNYERDGFWTNEPISMRYYISSHAKGNGPSFCRLETLDWAKKILEICNDPGYSDYLIRIYLHDEIWEAVGRRGEYTVPLSKVIDLDRAIVMNSRIAAWPSFMEPGVDKPWQYHIKLPNDIAELFYYCGRDERLQQYVNKLVEPRRALFNEWCADPGFMAAVGTDSPRQIFSFWISTQLHVTKYTSVRRQAWWLRHHGIDSISSWAWSSGGYEVYANRILHWIALHARTSEGTGYLLTDRGLAWMDMKEDMELITLVRLLAEQIKDKKTLVEIDELAGKALEASQRNDFEAARHHYVSALKALRPDLSYLAPRDLYRGLVKAKPLPDLFKEDEGYREAQKLPKATVPFFEAAGNRPSPSVDGILDNAYLEQGVTLEMRDAMQGSRLKAPTTTYLVRDRENLYILFDCNEPRMANLRIREKDRDGNVWQDDCVEIFVDRAGVGKNLAHIIVNAVGTRYDSTREEGLQWNPDYKSAVRRQEKSWTVEFKLPFKILGGPPKPGETWRMNFCRERRPVNEIGAWSVTFGGFHNLERFGYIHFK